MLEICEGASPFVIILEETTAQSLQQSEALRQSILKKIFERKLVEQNIKDEPALKLLKWIKSDRERVMRRMRRERK
ncbi:MAG: hypothetical protein EDM70_18425 [Candidatus Brocadia sp. AMX2]|uniref:Restriction endonuclease S subunits n=1 Tax=Candidatus Brocadia sinica JPN1 TaxID=1197129 RepID=A0ABQ0JU69_9BACT|nr:MAG: hypothetical protein EDM70_18425 [Candidatus Brocadia sp. AMX2]GAN32285.1 restriction endonuclease S subunits [Candidatus Brocadia sinica JPN1]GIK14165.1 MAG: hypothetical protein BroJett002_28720 [Candidatus Brocadia sinica]GJQ19401.1 MAG: hypothetical protein HBSIN01_33600 [Candidatus Brocadia sinica]